MRRPLPVLLFALAAASPLAFLALALARGGLWGLLAFLWMGFASAAMDLALPLVAPETPPDQEFPGSDALLLALGAAALCLPSLAAWTLPRDLPAALTLLAAGLWLGQVGHPAAHELIHRPQRGPRALGVAVYALLGMGHHASAHRLVHHARVGTPDDPNTPRAGEGFWHFAPRAWAGSFRAGRRAERGPRAYAIYLALGLLGVGLAALVGGPRGVLIWLALASLMQGQILLSDYVQHYGLTRARLPDGRLEPVGPGHSWNAGHWASSALMLNATRHSDHHCHPTRPYPALALARTAPRLPWPLPVAACVALLPPLWRRRMAPLLAAQPAKS